MKLLRRLRSLFRRDKLDAEMVEEMRLHVELQTERNIAAGMSPDEARYAALRQFGNVASVQERTRMQRFGVGAELLWRDMCFAAVSLRRSPGFAITAAITLGLSVAVVSVVAVLFNTIVLTGADWLKEPDRVVYAISHPANQPGNERRLSWQEVMNWQERAESFSLLSAFSPSGGTMTVEGRSEWEFGAFVARDLFAVLGAGAIRGRVLTDADFSANAARVVVISHKFWLERFAGAEDVLGRTVEFNSTMATVVGVMPPGFSFPEYANYWLPLDLWMPDFKEPKNRTLAAIGRLRDGVSKQQAGTEISVLAAQGRMSGEDAVSGRVTGFIEYGGRQYRQRLDQFILAVLVVQLLACANVAGLMLARGGRRLPQTVLRAAFGASRWRLVREILLEGMLLAMAGLALGWMLAYWLRPMVVASLTPQWPLPAWWQFEFYGRVLGFTAGVTLTIMFLMSLIPAWHCTGARLADGLRSSGPSRADPPASRRWRAAAVVLQLAAATVLMVIAGLAWKNARAFATIDLGVDPEGVAMFGYAPLGKRSPEQMESYFRTLVNRLQALPGVEAAGFAYPMPGQYGRDVLTLAVEGRPDEAASMRVINSFITPEMLQVVRLKLLKGRGFTDMDDAKAAPVALIDRLIAERVFPGEDPLGKRVGLGRPGVRPQEWLTVVGVVEATRIHALSEQKPVIYRPVYGQRGMVGTYAFVRSRDAVPATVQRALGALREVDPKFAPMVAFQGSYKQWIENVYWTHLLSSRLMTVFAALAFFMAVLGIYGLMAYVVSQQVREAGIRLALGATAGRVVGGFMIAGAKLTLVGLGCGLVTMLVLAPQLAAWVPRATPRDPVIYVVTAAVIGAVVLLATWLPARRAAKVDPVEALRAE